ncbi:hypothetical protein C8R43DRAFT_951405 [Mycena crocata]|nr:hypothetical protein C8R43DRAFT_954556 [Mycena crocata]KAJ7150996.1 hypothetical protein C8R43DRAFT_951405 [Mycena crocata]
MAPGAVRPHSKASNWGETDTAVGGCFEFPLLLLFLVPFTRQTRLLACGRAVHTPELSRRGWSIDYYMYQRPASGIKIQEKKPPEANPMPYLQFGVFRKAAALQRDSDYYMYRVPTSRVKFRYELTFLGAF